MTPDSRSAGAAPSLEEMIAHMQREEEELSLDVGADIQEGGDARYILPALEMRRAISDALRELAALRTPVADGEVTDLVLRLHRYHHAMHEEKGHRMGSELMVQAAALLEKQQQRIAALKADARKWAWYRKRHGQMPGEETADEWAEEQMALEEKQRAWLASRAGPEPRE
jgi:hypothetical protein